MIDIIETQFENKSTMQQVSGLSAPVKGLGIVPISLTKSNTILLTYTCYHIMDNLQGTLELIGLKFYCKIRTVRLESLYWLKIATEDGVAICISTITYYHKIKLLYYII